MKYLIGISLIFLLASFNTIKDDTLKLYLIALSNHIHSIENGIKKHNDKKAYLTKIIYVINDDIVELPDNIELHKIQVLGDSVREIMSNDNSLHAIKLHPITVQDGYVVVTLSDYVVTKYDNDVKFSYSGGKDFFFWYNKAIKQYKLEKTKVISF